MSSGFGKPIPLDQIRSGDRLEFVAGQAELEAIAARLRLLSLTKFDAHAVLERSGQEVRAHGRIKAKLEQPCVATGEPVLEHIDEPFELRFAPEPGDGRGDDEVELSAADCETIFHDGRLIAIGEALEDTLALALDPYPRSAGADLALREAGVMTEEEAGPFAALARLRKTDS